MIESIFDARSVIGLLKQGQNDSAATVRRVQHAIANGTTPGFVDRLAAGGEPLSLEEQMALLADAQIRFQAESRLLSLNYEKIRSTLRLS